MGFETHTFAGDPNIPIGLNWSNRSGIIFTKQPADRVAAVCVNAKGIIVGISRKILIASSMRNWNKEKQGTSLLSFYFITVSITALQFAVNI